MYHFVIFVVSITFAKKIFLAIFECCLVSNNAIRLAVAEKWKMKFIWNKICNNSPA